MFTFDGKKFRRDDRESGGWSCVAPRNGSRKVKTKAAERTLYFWPV
jgi:hypothetical protein